MFKLITPVENIPENFTGCVENADGSKSWYKEGQLLKVNIDRPVKREDTMKDDLALPSDVELAVQVHTAIVDVLKKDNSCCTGGCRAFYSPAEWRERGESYGLNSLLVVVYDGGSLAPYFNLDKNAGSLYKKMSKALERVGCYAEECTCWYSAIYPSRKS